MSNCKLVGCLRLWLIGIVVESINMKQTSTFVMLSACYSKENTVVVFMTVENQSDQMLAYLQLQQLSDR
jgi:hypothetical protein